MASAPSSPRGVRNSSFPLGLRRSGALLLLFLCCCSVSLFSFPLLAAGSQIRVGVMYIGLNPTLALPGTMGRVMFPLLYNRLLSLMSSGVIGPTILSDGSDLTNITFIYQDAASVTLPGIAAATAALLNGPNRPHVLICPLGDFVEGCATANESPSYNPQGPLPAFAPGTPNLFMFQCLANPLTGALPPQCTRQGDRRFQYLHGLLGNGGEYFQSIVPLLRQESAQHVVIITEDYFSFYSQITEGLLEALQENGIDASVLRIPNLRKGAPVISLSLAQQLVTDMIALNRPIDAIFASTSSCYDLSSQFQLLNYSPKLLLNIACFTANVGSLQQQLKYLMIPLLWDPHLKGPDFVESITNLAPVFPTSSSASGIGYSQLVNPLGSSNVTVGVVPSLLSTLALTNTVSVPSPMQFAQLFNQTFGAMPTYAHTAVCAMVPTIVAMLRAANATTVAALQNALQTYYETSFFGIIAFNRFGYNDQIQFVMAQFDQTTTQQIIVPLSASTMGMIYPVPGWDERVYQPSMFSSSLELAIFALIGVFSVPTLLVMSAIVYYRKHTIIRAISWLFAFTMGIGCMMAYLAPLTWPLENNDSTCGARVWFFTLPFHLLLDPLIAKSYRILRIFYSAKLTVKRIRDSEVAVHSLVLAAPQLIINIIWVAVSNPVAAVQVPDALRPVNNYTDCASDITSPMVGVTVAYSALIVVGGCVMAILVRGTAARFNDAKSIGMAIYAFSLPVLIITILQLFIATGSNRSALFIIRSLGIFFAFSLCYLVLYASRLWCIYQGIELEFEETTNGTKLKSSVNEQRTNNTINNNNTNKSNKSNQYVVKEMKSRNSVVSMQPTSNNDKMNVMTPSAIAVQSTNMECIVSPPAGLNGSSGPRKTSFLSGGSMTVAPLNMGSPTGDTADEVTAIQGHNTHDSALGKITSMSSGLMPRAKSSSMSQNLPAGVSSGDTFTPGRKAWDNEYDGEPTSPAPGPVTSKSIDKEKNKNATVVAVKPKDTSAGYR